MQMRCNIPALFGGVAVCALLVGPALADGAPDAGHESGVWQKHQYSFAFLGFTSTYSCDGLADKLKVLLIAAGARSDVKASGGGCPEGFGVPDKLARADLSFYTLVPGGSDLPANSTVGAWRPVFFTARTPRELGTGDCELVEQFKSSVLPMFSTRNVESHTVCVPHQESGSSIDLKFETFGVSPAQAPR